MHKTAFGMALLLKKRVLSPNVFEEKDEEEDCSGLTYYTVEAKA